MNKANSPDAMKTEITEAFEFLNQHSGCLNERQLELLKGLQYSTLRPYDLARSLPVNSIAPLRGHMGAHMAGKTFIITLILKYNK